MGYHTTVARGPFKGMKYPRLKSSYSEMAPKLLGSYEAELFGPLEEITRKEYKQVIDIGCAEGYYAIGLALKIPTSTVYAYDINPNALKMCKEMAIVNNVLNRVHLGERCTNETLKNFKFENTSLIVCDCEGYELELFTNENIKNLNRCDFLIELHDILGLPVKERLLPVFRDTHNIQLISSEVRDPNLYPELEGMEEIEKKIVLSECRDGLFGSRHMEWAYITSKNIA
ncbi:hypothetical protein SAE01_41220 [Segetibacter aerophilus]|uniref:Methyltransferase domain-containing protein n=1 Tax=Segetibacter aerophilus TaxID=670293 RepID=A0A512BI21_9BACT|nr:hypothetical protein SAE01_41220 [Segetibacter aerophilus]